MAKKLPLLISTLTAATIGLCSTSGLVWADEPQTSWTYEEMVAFSREVEAEIEAACADSQDFMCASHYIYEQPGDIYRALSKYENMQMTITAINPNLRTMRIYFDDVDFFTKHMDSSLEYHSTLKNLYISNFDEGYANPGFYMHPDTADPHQRILINESHSVDEIGWFPSNTEQTFSTPNLVFKPGMEPYLYFYYDAYPNSSRLDPIDISTCINSVGEGEECQVRFGADQLFYVPVAVPTSTQTSEPTQDTDTDNDAILTNNSANNSTENVINQLAVSTTIATTDATATPRPLSSTSVLAPNTGSAEANTSWGIELPWWLGAIFVIGLTALAWLFWPNHQKSPKKL